MKKSINKGIISIFLPIIILIVWYIATTKSFVPAAILPSISKVIESFKEQIVSGQLFTDIGVSLIRVLKGYSLAVALGIFLGVIMGISNIWEKFFSLTLHTIRQIPMLAWIPLIILWFGIGEKSKVAVIILGAFFPIMMNTMSAIRQTNIDYIEVAKLYRLSKWDTFKTVYLPSAIPQIFVGLKLGLGISWMAVVAAEMIAASSGIGFRISDARTLMQADIVIVGMIVIGFVGVLMDKVLTKISKKITPWTKVG